MYKNSFPQINHDDIKSSLLANKEVYDDQRSSNYMEGAPHLVHADLISLLEKKIDRAIQMVTTDTPHILDLGAGEGSVTHQWLMRGAHVTAVDLSISQLTHLRFRCSQWSGALTTIADDANEYLINCKDRYDIISCISFLHHIPDYLSIIKHSYTLLKKPGVLLTFADPIRYDSLGALERGFERISYAFWRIRRPDLIGGVKRRLRRMHGIYLQDSIFDNAEYHITRNGVDQDAIVQILREQGMQVWIDKYWSTQSAYFQKIGNILKFTSGFSIYSYQQ